MGIGHMINLFMPLPAVLVLFGLAALVARRRKDLPRSAARIDPVVRIAETSVLLSAGLVAFVSGSCLNDGLLLQLDKLRPAFATTHLVVAGVAVVLLISGLLLSWFGRTSGAVLLTTIVLFCYATVLARSPFNGPGYLMTLIAPKDSYEPQVDYTFKVNGDLQGAEVWINGVFLGKTPLKMTGRQFHDKVPFLAEPPEGFSEQSQHRPKGGWFRINLLVLDKRDDFADGGISYLGEFKDYYAKVRFADEWGENGVGTCGGGGDQYKRDYEVSLRASFPGVVAPLDERRRHLETLVQKARLADCRVEPEWFEAISTHGEEGWMEVRKLAMTEKGFAGIFDKWIEWKYGVTAETTADQAAEVFRRICDQADTEREYNSASPAGRAVELIFDKLDVDKLVDTYENTIKSGRPMYSARGGKEVSDILGSSYFWARHEPSEDDRKKVLPASISVIGHAISLWDEKLDAEDDDKDNIIERKISPALLVRRDDVENAAALGGHVVETYLLRHYRWEPRVSGIDLKSRAREYTLGLHLNKWLYRLAQMDNSAGRRFRIEHDREVIELADLIVGSPHNSSKTPPDFLFFDLDRGKASPGYEYWPAYFTHVESSFPSWQREKLKKRWAYLVRFGSLATLQMYMDCWAQMSEVDILDNPWRVLQELKELPRDVQIPVARAIVRRAEKQLAGEEGPISRRERDDLRQKKGYIDAIRIYLACLDDAESIDRLVSRAGSASAGELGAIMHAMEAEDVLGPDLMKALVRLEIPGLSKLPLKTILQYPTAENRILLAKLLEDSNEEVRSAAQSVAKELEEIAKTPLRTLTCQEKGD